MTGAERFAELSTGLADGVRGRDGLIGLVLLGSASDAGAVRRDEWSDHDFFALVEAGRGPEIRPDLDWLPDSDRVALIAREGEIGFAAVYDDGHVFEFAFSEAGELDGSLAGDATVVVDDEAGTTAELIAQARARADAGDRFDPANDTRLVLVKLLIGVGRARRGEVLNAGSFVRSSAVQLLVRAIRGRFADRSTTLRDTDRPRQAVRTRLPGVGRAHRRGHRGAGGGRRSRAVRPRARDPRARMGRVPLPSGRRCRCTPRLGALSAAVRESFHRRTAPGRGIRHTECHVSVDHHRAARRPRNHHVRPGSEPHPRRLRSSAQAAEGGDHRPGLPARSCFPRSASASCWRSSCRRCSPSA